jgi:hypothetical protein
MKKTLSSRIILFITVLITGFWLSSTAYGKECTGLPDQTVGLFCNDGAYPGYTLFKPLRGTSVYLIDNDGNLIHQWDEPDRFRGVTMLLTEEGTLIRNLCYDTSPCRGNGRLLREYDWEGNVIWECDYPGAHHDMVRMPNGNLLFTVQQPDRTESLVEMVPDYDSGYCGEEVWNWYVRDHVVPVEEEPADHPELFDVAGYVALNALDYNPARDEILMSFNRFSEIIIIGHYETSNILYRWGNPANYGMNDIPKTGFQHSTKWIKPEEYGYSYNHKANVGNILWFNNNFNQVDEIKPPIDKSSDNYTMKDGVFGPDNTTWSYAFGERLNDQGQRLFDAGFQSSAQRLPNGNTLIALSNDMTFIEVTNKGDIVWKYVSPFCSNNDGGEPQDYPDYIRAYNGATCDTLGFDVATTLHFNVKRYSPDFRGFDGKDLSPQWELVPLP